jgi:hypothetical protein
MQRFVGECDPLLRFGNARTRYRVHPAWPMRLTIVELPRVPH